MDRSQSIVAFVFLLVFFLGCTSQQVLAENPDYDETPTHTIMMKSFSYVPYFSVVENGTIVTWANKDQKPHIIQFDKTSSPEIEPGQSWSYQFTEPGMYQYRDAVSGATGVLIVE